MKIEMLFRSAVVLVFLAGLLATPATAELYVGPGAAVLGQARVPYLYPYGPVGPDLYSYGYMFPYGPWHVFPSVPPPARYGTPSFSYRANPYVLPPRTFSYEVPPSAYAPDSFPYDLRAYGYGYPPPIQPPRLYFYRYHPGPREGTSYRPMSLREYKVRQLGGPVRVRDIVPGVPELGG
jgi:hypothetical protein